MKRKCIYLLPLLFIVGCTTEEHYHYYPAERRIYTTPRATREYYYKAAPGVSSGEPAEEFRAVERPSTYSQ